MNKQYKTTFIVIALVIIAYVAYAYFFKTFFQPQTNTLIAMDRKPECPEACKCGPDCSCSPCKC